MLTFVGLLGLTGCDREREKDTGFHFDQARFISERNGWEAAHIMNYSFTLAGELPYWNFSRAILMRPYEVRVVVRNGVMDSYNYIGEAPRDEITGKILEPEFTSVTDMFEKIAKWATNQKVWWGSYDGKGGLVSTSYQLKYSPTLHYITFFEPISQWKSDYIVDATAHAVSVYDFTVEPAQ